MSDNENRLRKATLLAAALAKTVHENEPDQQVTNTELLSSLKDTIGGLLKRTATLQRERDAARSELDAERNSYELKTTRLEREHEEYIEALEAAFDRLVNICDEASYTEDNQAMYVDPARIQEARDTFDAVVAARPETVQ